MATVLLLEDVTLTLTEVRGMMKMMIADVRIVSTQSEAKQKQNRHKRKSKTNSKAKANQTQNDHKSKINKKAKQK